MLAVCRACQFFLPDLIGCHVLIRSDNMSMVFYINHQGGLFSKRLLILVERLLEWAQFNHIYLANWTRERICYLGAMLPQRSGCSNRRWFKWFGRSLAGRSISLHLQRQFSLLNILFEGQGCVGPRLAQPPLLCIPPDRPDPTGHQSNQGTRTQGSLSGPPLGKPTLVVRADSAAGSSHLARAPETGSPLSNERDNMAPSARYVGSSPFAAQREPTSLPERVLNTISEARAPSSRCLYALKWSIFSTWCLDRGEDPSTFELSVVLSFLQELLHKRRSPSTLKVFVAGLPCPYSRPIGGQVQLICPLSEGSQKTESALAPRHPYMGFAYCVEGPEDATVYEPSVTVTKDCSATSTSVG